MLCAGSDAVLQSTGVHRALLKPQHVLNPEVTRRWHHPQVDPTLTRADRLVGQVLGQVGALPDVFTELEINFFLLRRLLGVRTTVSLLD